MAGFDDHFGEEIEIETESINVISGYLISNSAEKGIYDDDNVVIPP